MTRAPRITAKELIRRLEHRGFVVTRTRRSHVRLRHPDSGAAVTVPVHGGDIIGPGLLKSICAQAGIDPAELSRDP